MTAPAPITSEEFADGVEALLAEKGLFAVEPKTVRGVDYDRSFLLSNMSVRDMFAAKAAEFADRDFLVYGEERLTTAEAWSQAMRFANWLVTEKGVKPGDRVAIAMRNYPEWCIAYLGIAAAGAVIVPINSFWQADELRQGLTRAAAKIVVCDAKRGAAFLPCKEELGLTFVGAREEVEAADVTFAEIVNDSAISATPPQVRIDPDSDYCLIYTSGTTGKPKGVLLTHRSCINSVMSFSFLLNVAQRLRPEFPFVPENPSILVTLPLFHVTASHTVLLLSFLTGKKLVFLYRWDPVEAGKLIAKEKITNFIGVPTMAHDLTRHADPEDLVSLVDIATGGAKRPETQLAEQAETFPGKSMSSGYGLTETNALGTHITLQDFLDNPSAAGRVVPPVTQIEAFSEDGTQLSRGEKGEICIKSPANFRAYLEDEAATEAAFNDGGWFRTGDLGYVDEDGILYILDRAKDLIIRGGENISCLEVENMLLSFPGVDEACVFAVPDEKYGEIVGATVWSAKGQVDLEKLRAHTAEKLAAFKVPQRLWASPQSLPRGTTGKIDKRMIRQVTAMYPAHYSVD